MKQLDTINAKLNVLRKELYALLATNATFQEIYDVSIKIDDLIVVYYKENNVETYGDEKLYLEKYVV